MPLSSQRLRFLAIAGFVFPLAVFTKFYSGAGAHWISAHAGGALYVVFWVFLALAIIPRLAPWLASSGVFVLTSMLEFLQLWHPPLLHELRSTFVGHALLGSTFAWSDFPFYAVGAVVAYALARRIGPRSDTLAA